nr:adenylyl-sulfate kinase [Actinospica robiniae]
MIDPRTVGATIWLTGLPSSGKSTIAAALADVLCEEGHRVQVLDGDEIRATLSSDLGFSRADRITNVQRIGLLARTQATHGVKVLAPVIAPYACSRDDVRAGHAAHGVWFVEVHIATAVEVCARRDVKGLYRRRRAGEIRGLTGVDDPYEIPDRPELRVETDGLTVAESVKHIYTALAERGLV